MIIGLNLLNANKLASYPVVGLKKLYADGDRFFLEVKPNGRRFVFRCTIAGKKAELPCGVYPKVSIKSARETAAKMREALAKGGDPWHVIYPVAEAKGKTFADYSADLIDSKKAGWRNGKHHGQWLATLKAYAFPKIGDKAPSEITVADVQALLKPIWSEKTETATRVRQRVEAVLDYAYVLEGIDKRNPARWKGHLEKLLTAPRKLSKVRNHPSAPYADVPAIMAALRAKDCTSARLLRFSILTASRSGNARDARWPEFDLDAAVWNIAAERMKAGVAHRVSLAPEAIAILREQATRRDPKSDRVFPGAREGGLLSDVAVAKVLASVYPNVTTHGFRSSFRMWGAEQTNYSSEALEMCLAHNLLSATERAYQRSDLFDIRVKIMADWQAYLG